MCKCDFYFKMLLVGIDGEECTPINIQLFFVLEQTFRYVIDFKKEIEWFNLRIHGP